MNKENFWNLARKVLINKYAITIYVFAVIMIIPCELAGGVALVIFALLLWGSVIAFLVLSIIIAIKKKNAKRNKSY